MNRLYPLKFKPIIKDKIWGGTRLKRILNKPCKTEKAGESWEISGYPGNISRVSNGFLKGNNLEEIIEVYMGDLVGDSVFEKFGTFFPLLIKFIDANEVLSIQVHPDDKMALKQFGSFGKTEMWYVIEAEEDAKIIVGFNQTVTKETYLKHLKDKMLLSILNAEKTFPGDVYFLPPGRIHAIGQGILLTEIQQTSDATLRIYDFDRVDEKGKPRALHTENAMEVIDFKAYPKYKIPYAKVLNKPSRLVNCEYFTTNYLMLQEPVEREYHQIDSFVIFICLEGKLDIHFYQNEKETLMKGETTLLPAEIKDIRLMPKGKAKLLEVYVESEKTSNRIEEMLDSII